MMNKVTKFSLSVASLVTGALLLSGCTLFMPSDRTVYKTAYIPVTVQKPVAFSSPVCTKLFPQDTKFLVSVKQAGKKHSFIMVPTCERGVLAATAYRVPMGPITDQLEIKGDQLVMKLNGLTPEGLQKLYEVAFPVFTWSLMNTDEAQAALQGEGQIQVLKRFKPKHEFDEVRQVLTNGQVTQSLTYQHKPTKYNAKRVPYFVYEDHQRQIKVEFKRIYTKKSQQQGQAGETKAPAASIEMTRS